MTQDPKRVKKAGDSLMSDQETIEMIEMVIKGLKFDEL